MSNLDDLLKKISDEEGLEDIQTNEEKNVKVSRDYESALRTYRLYVRTSLIIGGLTLLNILFMVLDFDLQLVISLDYPVISRFFFYAFTSIPKLGNMISLVLISLVYLFFLMKMMDKRRWAVIALMVFYIFDGLMGLLAFDIISLFIHGLLIFWTVSSMKLLRVLNTYDSEQLFED